ncbi:hypothetical protein J0J30_23715, partial [Vibrio vulnificus]|nr:hypothetical protein [Vibrio vulnificus]
CWMISLMIGMKRKMEYGVHLRSPIQLIKDHGSPRYAFKQLDVSIFSLKPFSFQIDAIPFDETENQES